MTKQINSVFGLMGTDQLGTTLMHEHIAIYDWAMRMSFGKRWLDTDRLVHYVGELLKQAREQYGVCTMVEGSAVNIGRDVHLIKAVAEYAGVNMIVSSGMYHNDDLFLEGKPAEQIMEVLLEECEHGIQDTGIKPGILKCATDRAGITHTNQMILDAVSVVQTKTGLPLFVHSAPEIRVGILQQEVFRYHGVDLSRVIMGHSGDTNDIYYLETMLKAGSYLGMDRFGIGNGINPVENRVDTIYELCKRGWIDKLILSQDCCPVIDWGEFKCSMMDDPNQPLRDFNFTYMHRKAIPLLLKKGLSQSDIDHMLIDNPRRFFEG